MSWERYLFGFRGRLNRMRYWLFVLIAVPVLLALLSTFYIYAISQPGAYENGGPTPWPSDLPGMIGAGLWSVALTLLFVSLIAVTVKRLHDRGKAWWWLIVFVFAPNAFYAFGQYLLDSDSGAADSAPFLCNFVALALSVWAFVELGCLRGTAGDNRYGSDPLATRH